MKLHNILTIDNNYFVLIQKHYSRELKTFVFKFYYTQRNFLKYVDKFKISFLDSFIS